MRLPVFPLILALCACLCGCGGSSQPDHVFRFHNGAEPETLDPALMTGVLEVRIAAALLEGLVKVDSTDPQSVRVVPGMAERWEVSDDQKTYTFHLRDASWSNDDPVRASDFEYAWKRLLTPSVGAKYTDQFRYIKNAMPYFTGKTTSWADVGIKSLDDKTLQVALEHPCPFFINLSAMFMYYPVNPRVVGEFGDRWTRRENYVGNGPFRMLEWRPNDRIVVQKNPGYWAAAGVKLNRVEIFSSENLDTNLNAFLAGETDWITDFPVPRTESVLAKKEYHGGDALGVSFFRFNTTRKPFDDSRVRRAFNLALDKDNIVRHITRCGEKAADHFTPPTITHYTAPKGPGYNVEEARRLLAEAGFPGGKGIPKLTLIYNQSENRRAIAQAAVSMWKEALGVEVELVNLEWKVFLAETRNLHYDLASSGWIADYPDVNTFLDMWRSDTMDGNNNNNTGWRNPPYDALIEEANQQTDLASRAEIFHRAEELLLAEMPIAPCYFYVNRNLVQARVVGWRDNAWNYHPLEFLSVQAGATP